MRFLKPLVGTATVVALSIYHATATDGGAYSDTCAQVNAELKVPQPLIPSNLIGIGIISKSIPPLCQRLETVDMRWILNAQPWVIGRCVYLYRRHQHLHIHERSRYCWCRSRREILCHFSDYEYGQLIIHPNILNRGCLWSVGEPVDQSPRSSLPIPKSCGRFLPERLSVFL
jgi:hypothetical protein